MAYADAGLASGYILRLTVNVASQNIALNTTTYSYSLVIHKGSGSGKWMSGTSYWSVRTPFGNVISSGSIGSYDFRAYSALTLAASSITIAGSASRDWGGVFDDNDTWGELGDGTISGLWVAPPSIPLTPSGLGVTRVSDTQQSLAWTNGSGYSSVIVQRSTDDGAFVEISRPAGSPTSFSDTTTQANRKYTYRVAGIGGAGQSAWSNLATIYTSPAAPASATAERITQTLIRVDATGLPPHATLYDIMDGVTVIATGVSLPWDHVNPNPATPHTYRVRGTIGAIQGAWSAPSNTVQLQAPPNAPTSLSPNGTTANVATNTLLRWLHNPVDASVQTQYQIRRRLQGSPTWVDGAVTTSANSEYLAAPAFFGAAGTYEWQVRTRGADPNFSPWSATATVTLITAPTAAINQPGPLHTASSVTVQWAYFQTQGRPQSAWELVLLRDGQEIETRSGSDGTSSLLLGTRLVDGGNYTVRVRVAAGLVWSDWAEQAFVVQFQLPAPPTLEGSWNEPSGSVDLTVNDNRGPAVPDVVNLFTNPNFVGDGTYAEVARFPTGSTPPEVAQPEDFRIRDLGTGESVMEIQRVRGVTVLNCIAGVSTRNGEPAARLIATGSSPDSFMQIAVPVSAQSLGTQVGTSSSNFPISGAVSTYLMGLREGEPMFRSAPRPNDAVARDLRSTFGPLTTVMFARWYHGGLAGSPDVWWTRPGLFVGDYGGPAFAGDSGQVVIDDQPRNTRWSGAPNNSTSIASRAEAATRIELERSIDGGVTWEYIASLPPALTNMSDFESLSCGLTKYRASAYTDEGATAETIIDVVAESLAIYLGAGPGFSHVARLPYDPAVKIGSLGRRRAVEEYEGRERPIAYASRRKVLSMSASGTIFDEDPDAAIRDRLEDVIEDPSPVHCFRDFYGNRYYGAVSPVSLDGLGRRPSCAPSCASGYWRFGFSMEGTERA